MSTLNILDASREEIEKGFELIGLHPDNIYENDDYVTYYTEYSFLENHHIKAGSVSKSENNWCQDA